VSIVPSIDLSLFDFQYPNTQREVRCESVFFK
jgi:hypothetical protein